MYGIDLAVLVIDHTNKTFIIAKEADIVFCHFSASDILE